jgi:hypothetical protein
MVLAVAVAAPNHDQRWTIGGCAIAAMGAAVLLVSGQHPHVSRLAPDDVALAAAGATAFLAIGVRASARAPTVAAAVTVVTCGIASGSPGHPSTVGPVLAIAAAIVLLTLTHGPGRITIAALSTGAVVVAAGVRTGGHGGAAAVIIGVALVGIAASISTRRAINLLTPLALLLGLHVAPALTDTAQARWLAVALGVAGAGLALLRAIAPRGAAPALCAALVPWTLAAAVGPLSGTGVAARALAAGTVIALALGGPLALLAATPGGALLAYAIADGQGWPRPVLAVLVLATVFGLTQGHAGVTAARLRVVDVIAIAGGAWFVLRPTSWTWTRVAGLRAYSDGAALAVASALIAGVLVAMTGGRPATEPLASWMVAGEDQDSSPPARLGPGMVAATALTGLIAAALVRSARL